MSCCAPVPKPAPTPVEPPPPKPPANDITNDFALEMMKEHGWDKGLWYFGTLFSESNAKLITYFEILGLKLNEDVGHVLVDFNANPLSEDGKSWGLDDETWFKFTGGSDGGRGTIPVMAMDGRLYTNSSQILKLLFEKFEPEAPEAVKTAFYKYLELHEKYDEPIVMPLLKYFGWNALQGGKENYKAFNQLPEAEIKRLCGELDTFMKILDQDLAGKKFYVGDKCTVVDCLMMWFPASLYQVISFPVAEKYPNVWAYYQGLVANPPPGSAEFLTGTFPMFCKVIWLLNMSRAAGGRHWVGNARYWGGSARMC